MDDGVEDDSFLDDELFEDDDGGGGYFDDEYFEEKTEPTVGDGAGGGGISLAARRSGSPDMTDIEAFTKTYRSRLDEAETTANIPGYISFEVSSPGVERLFRIPQDLEQFKDRNLYVKYMAEATDGGSTSEHEGNFRLVCYDA